MKNRDEKIKKLIKAIEQEIPIVAEKKFLHELDKISASDYGVQKKINIFVKIALATAACLVVASLIFSPVGHRKTNRFQEVILIESAKIQGKSATTYIFEEKDPEMTIVWIER